MKLTDWYSGDQKPVRIGAYERDFGVPFTEYSWWNGKEFGVGYFGLSACLSQQMEPMISPKLTMERN
jgi:hypothetical protein